MGAWAIKKATNSDLSCVIFAIKWFLVYKGLYSLFRLIVFCFVMREFLTGSTEWAVLDNLHDATGTRLLTKDDDQRSPQEVPLHVSFFSLVGDTSNLGASMWMFILFIELIRLGRRSMDRGKELEDRVRRCYMYTISAILAIYFTVLAVYLATYYYNDVDHADERHAFLATRSSLSRIMTFAMQLVSTLAGVAGLVILRGRGEQVVSTGGQVSQSPLYNRIKRIVIVDIIFLLPFAIAMIMLEHYSADASAAIGPTVVADVVGAMSILYYASGFVLALILAGSQECCATMCMCHADDTDPSVLGSARAPLVNPVFVNTDIEASSALWGRLGSAMHDAQELHDHLLRSLLVAHNGYEITTAGDSFQLAFHTIEDAIAYCLDVQEQLLTLRWPKALATMNGSRTVVVDSKSALKKAPFLFHGLRVRMGIHASSDKDQLFKQTHPVTYKTNYVGLSELIGREVSDLGHGGQIVITAPVAKWLREAQASQSEWAETHPCIMRELGVYRVKDLKIDLGVAYIVPHSLRDRIRFFTPLDNVEDKDEYTRRSSTAYDLLISPKDVVHII
ncbi:Aste57867_8947 [Aphanomyces stellatus]|uniref:Aste57867_8947 protein n=1 Tax=Aphanomyces stellatus TaxID=120398 RepID=A0A485KLJ3_9STRA|nr:hypothetical protein As57867_008912 [Aphanomyces stellatus]VFT85831.1 Aste57867_8947 [Aphanomyces stellatus]